MIAFFYWILMRLRQEGEMITFSVPVPADQLPQLEAKLQTSGFQEATINGNPMDLMIQGDHCKVETVYDPSLQLLSLTVLSHPWIVSDAFVEAKIKSAIQAALNMQEPST